MDDVRRNLPSSSFADERLGLVSASRFEILALCPGSEQLRRKLPEAALNTVNNYSERGTKLHKAFETGKTLELDESDLEIYKRGIATEQQIISDWCNEFGLEHYTELEREERLFLHDPKTLKPLTSGQLDRKYASFPYMLVIDFKCLWCSNLTPAEQNYQGRLQAVLAANEHEVHHVRIAFNKAMFGRADVCDYDANALAMARWSIFYHIWESEQPGAPIKPGSWCTYCPCKAFCKEAAHYAMVPAIQRGTNLTETLERVKVMAPEDALKVWRRKNEITKIIEAITARLAGLPPEELERLGLKFKAGKKTDKIADVVSAFDSLLNAGFDRDTLLKSMSFSKERLISTIQDFKNCRETEAESFYENELGEFIQRGRGKPTLEL